MTLLDTRPGIAAAFRALSAATGVYVDTDLVVSRLGPPLATELRNWFPADRLDEVVSIYRSLYPEHAITMSRPLPGAVEALDELRAAGLRSMVVTAKHGPLARLHLEHLGMRVDELVGDLFAAEKATALTMHGAELYVGDHVADMLAARTAGIPGLGVTTGAHDADELRAAGADLVVADLSGFPQALRRLMRLAL
ncbi:hydrolase [Plantactinospora endophytica]|uniref:Hydrolase n=2 Tax=Plantactinospora endophytica TaxID=673535 RepID=A0ABQ4E7Z2_9ACTN|nr:hydrolase [Plantactinospora endophytica]